MINTCCSEDGSALSPFSSIAQLSLESTLQDLCLYDTQADINQLGIVIAQILETNPLIPGVILTEQKQLIGVISRRRFLERLSRPYGRELFLQRTISSLHRFAKTELLILSGNTLIVDAAHQAVQRSPELLYEPIIVHLVDNSYQLLDVQQLLVAQSHIHQLTIELLRQQTQSQLIQSEKLASLGQMIAGVAHEIRNPTSCILGNASCLENYYQDLVKLLQVYEEQFQEPCPIIEELKQQIEFDFIQQDLGEVVTSIKVSADRLSQLVNSLHSFSHMDGHQQRETNIHDCIDSTLLILKNRLKHGIKVVKHYGDIPLIRCYSGQISQVFMNLIANAIDALEESKSYPLQTPIISIYTTIKNHLDIDLNNRTNKAQLSPSNHLVSFLLKSETHNPTFLAREPIDSRSISEWLSIQITDNGIGIPEALQAQIFDTFFTTKPAGKGTGLGLAISYQIITEKHGGQLRCISTPNQGTEFEILLPII